MILLLLHSIIFIFTTSLLLAQEKAPKGLELEKGLSYADHPKIHDFIMYMKEKHQFDEKFLTKLFSGLTVDPAERKKQNRHTNQAAERKMGWDRYRKQFLTDKRIVAGVAFWEKYQKSLSLMERRYGIPSAIVVATLGMESFYGKNNGSFSVLKSLTIFAIHGNRRNQFYFRELEFFLLLCRKQKLFPATIRGSYSGALGPAQFIPSSAFHYAKDGDRDGQVDLFANFQDIIASVGYYYASCKWKKGVPIAKKHKKPPKSPSAAMPKKYLEVTVANGTEHWQLYHNYHRIKCYNSSNLYALTLFQLSILLKQAYIKVKAK